MKNRHDTPQDNVPFGDQRSEGRPHRGPKGRCAAVKGGSTIQGRFCGEEEGKNGLPEKKFINREGRRSFITGNLPHWEEEERDNLCGSWEGKVPVARSFWPEAYRKKKEQTKPACQAGREKGRAGGKERTELPRVNILQD